jgi:hypothetical protein
MTTLARVVSGHTPLPVPCSWVGAAREQQAQQLELTDYSRFHERRDTVLLNRIDIGARFDQGLSNLGRWPRQSGVKRHDPLLITRRCVDFTAACQQQLSSRAAAKERRQWERLKTVRRPGVHDVRLLSQQLLEARDDAHGRGLVDGQAVWNSRIQKA